MDQCGNGEAENRDIKVKTVALIVHHFVVALHCAERRFNDRAAGVLVFAAGLDMGLNPYHAFTLDFGLFTVAVGDKPVAAQQLNRRSPQIAR